MIFPATHSAALQTDWLVSPPELGFLFPAFEDRAANLYGSLYYTRSTADNHPELVDVLFKTEIPAPADVQKETFESVLGDALQNDCSLDVVQAVHQQLHGLIEEHKAEKDPRTAHGFPQYRAATYWLPAAWKQTTSPF